MRKSKEVIFSHSNYVQLNVFLLLEAFIKAKNDLATNLENDNVSFTSFSALLCAQTLSI